MPYRTFDILNDAYPFAPSCGILTYEIDRGTLEVDLSPHVGPNDVPLTFAPFVARGERHIDNHWTLVWVKERVVPPSRQNLGEVLRAHGMADYDPVALLLAHDGRCCQDDFYLRETTPTVRADTARALREARKRAGLSQLDLAQCTGIPQPTISRIERAATNPTVETLAQLAQGLGCHLRVEFAKSPALL